MTHSSTHHLNTRHCSLPTTQVKETYKVAEITDVFNNLRYKVELTSYDIINSGVYVLAYQIQVINYTIDQDPIVIFERPEVDQSPITNYDDALAIYNECIDTYVTLINAETRGVQAIDVLKEKIEYELTVPECCGTCKWVKLEYTTHNHVHHTNTSNTHTRLKCTNPLNQLDTSSAYMQHQHYHHHQHSHDDVSLFLNPNVNVFGVCPKYEIAP